MASETCPAMLMIITEPVQLAPIVLRVSFTQPHPFHIVAAPMPCRRTILGEALCGPPPVQHGMGPTSDFSGYYAELEQTALRVFLAMIHIRMEPCRNRVARRD